MNKNEPQIILLISGIAAAGKRSVAKILRDDTDHYLYVPSCTTRRKRPDEKEGIDYYFVKDEEFDQGIEKDEFVEWEPVHQYRYGRRKSDLEDVLNSGKIPIIEADVNSRTTFKNVFGPKLITVFVIPPDMETVLKRLRDRGTETEEDIEIRTSRYEMELSHRNHYDYTIVNDDLEKAQKELKGIVKKELQKRKQKTVFKKTLINFFLLLFFASICGAGLAKAFLLSQTENSNVPVASPAGDASLSGQSGEDTLASDTIDFPVEPKEEATKKQAIKKKIAAQPPQNTAPASNPVSTTTNTDGTQTTTVATAGSISQEDIAKIANAEVSPNDPLQIPYVDETGRYPNLGATVKFYLKNNLKWRNEIPAMKLITLKDAGASGWNGEYLGSYDNSPSGDITRAYGSIILNTYYIENSYCKDVESGSSCFEEYAKYIFSHEYGHHYTLYHKWVDLDLPISVRMPDQYYSIRPLAKDKTATDYSLGWQNCELEILAEDYSYLYSGFGVHAMSGIYGFPAAATKTWLDDLGAKADTVAPVEGDTEPAPPVEPETPTPAVDTEKPVITILQPTTNAVTLTSDQLAVQISATDNIGITKIEFYFDDSLQQSWNLSSLSLNLSFKNLPAGVYTLKFKVYDAAGNFSESVLTVTK